MIITLHRAKLEPATTGMVDIDGVLFGVTLERPWKDNAQNISCIPAGEYALGFTYSPRFQRETIQVLKVPGRWGIRIHPANYAHELEGCIAIAEKMMNGNAISGTLVPKLETMVTDALGRGQSVRLVILNPKVTV